jgi:predicted TIM-barrel fold metal-dependent hydrolase
VRIVPVVGLPFEEVITELWAAELAWLGEGVPWFDAHTHIGHHDPDGFEADPEELIAALDAAGQQRALVFAMEEPDGYRAPNDWVLRSCAESGGRLVPLARIDPKAPDAMEEAQRCLAAGAKGFKLHPRSDGFALPHPVVAELVALAGERRLPVLFHAGRGIPDLGDPIVQLATEHPGARLILAHAGISDLGLLAPHVAGLPNILFDTSWWHVSDMLTLFATVPPGQILYASDMPYGAPKYPALLMLRCARAVGLTPEQAAMIAGGQIERVLAGDDLLDLGPAAGVGSLGARVLSFERVISYVATAVQLTFLQGDPTQAFSLARLACQAPDGAQHRKALQEMDRYLALSQQRMAEGVHPFGCLYPAMVAMVLAGTAEAIPVA